MPAACLHACTARTEYVSAWVPVGMPVYVPAPSLSVSEHRNRTTSPSGTTVRSSTVSVTRSLLLNAPANVW